MRRIPLVPFAGALLLLGAAIPLQAQRVTLAAGATADVGLDWPGDLETPVAPHARVGVALRPLTSRWNVEADAFHTAFRQESWRYGTEGVDANPTDWGAALTGTVTLRAARAVAPFLRLGVAHVESRTRVAQYGAAGARNYLERGTATVPVLGAGANLRLGRQALRLEARLQGGTAPNVPVTLGFSF